MATSKSGVNNNLDVRILQKGFHVNVEVGTGLRGTGWVGGQFVTYAGTSAPMGKTGREVGIVEKIPGTGNVAGFLVFSSSNSVNDRPEYLTSFRPEQTGVAAICRDAGKYAFYQFETANAAKRANPLAGADLVYALNDALYISDNGLLTNEDQFTPNSVRVGHVFHVPDATVPAQNFVGVDVRMP